MNKEPTKAAKKTSTRITNPAPKINPPSQAIMKETKTEVTKINIHQANKCNDTFQV